MGLIKDVGGEVVLSKENQEMITSTKRQGIHDRFD
jgi:hypothetical protein